MIIENRALWFTRNFASSRYNHGAVIIILKARSFQNGSQICWCFGVGNWSIILFSRIIINVIILLRRLIVKCFFLCPMLWCADKLATSISFAPSFSINRKRFVFGLIYFLYPGSSTAVYDTKFKNPLIIYILPKTYCHIFVTVTRHLCLAQQEGSTRIVTVFIPKIILFGSKPVDKIQVINLKAYQVDRYNFSITSSSNCGSYDEGKSSHS